MSIKEISDKFNIPIKGIVHIGANTGQEVEDYLELTDNIMLWEPIPELVEELSNKWPDIPVVEAAAWDEDTTIPFNITSFVEGSSALTPIEHSVDKVIEVDARRIDSVISENIYNVLVIDTQGSELIVLNGANLENFDIIVVETTARLRYIGSALKSEILDKLKETHLKIDDVPHSSDMVIFDTSFVKRSLLPEGCQVIIPIGGKGSRWNNYLSIPKYEAKVDGVKILDRTIDQLLAHNIKPVILKKGKYTYGDLDKIYITKDYWNESGRTIILFGDTFFTDNAINIIMSYDKPEWTVFGRIGKSSFSGKEYGELFAVSFYPEHIPKMEKCIKRVAALCDRGIVESPNLWALYRAMHKFPDDLMDKHFAGYGLEEINDWTEDFDWPADYDKFIDRWNNK